MYEAKLKKLQQQGFGMSHSGIHTKHLTKKELFIIYHYINILKIMSYIGLINVQITTSDSNVSASDDLTIGSSLRNLGTLNKSDRLPFQGH